MSDNTWVGCDDGLRPLIIGILMYFLNSSGAYGPIRNHWFSVGKETRSLPERIIFLVMEGPAFQERISFVMK